MATVAVRSRPYLDDDVHTLQHALASWIRDAGDCGYCHVGDVARRIYENRVSGVPVADLVRVWEDDGEVAGFAIHGRFGNAFDVFVAPALRGSDAELAMLRHTSEMTRELVTGNSTGEKFVITDVFDCDGARAALLEQLGFVRYRVWDHVTELDLSAARSTAAPELPEGFTLRSATANDAEQLAVARNQSFGAQWSADTYREAVMLQPGYDPEREIVAVAPDGRVAAFTVISYDDVNRVGLFEPVGTHREFQRRGLARAVMGLGLRAMRTHGMKTAIVEHDVTNVTASALYQGLGFRRKYETFGYRVSFA